MPMNMDYNQGLKDFMRPPPDAPPEKPNKPINAPPQDEKPPNNDAAQPGDSNPGNGVDDSVVLLGVGALILAAIAVFSR